MRNLAVRVWRPDDGDEIDGREPPTDMRPDDAAEWYAEISWIDADHANEQDIAVRCSDGSVRRFVVTAEQTVTFSAREIADAAPTQPMAEGAMDLAWSGKEEGCEPSA